jgi:hypothetical protein
MLHSTLNTHAGPQLGRQYEEQPKTELGQVPGVAAQLQTLEKNLAFLDEALRNLYSHLSPIRRDVNQPMPSEKAKVSEREDARSELAARLANHNAFLNEISYSIIQVTKELDI